MADSRRRRSQLRTRRKQRQTWLIAGIFAAAVILVGGAIWLYQANQVEGVETFPDQGNQHLQAPPATYLYNSKPPTSGPHAPNIAQWGEHSETVPEWLQVHNLEDGGVIIHYNCPEGCPELVEELRGILREMGSEQLILHPYTNMDSRIAVTAWTRLLAMDELDRGAVIDFIEAYRGIDHHK